MENCTNIQKCHENTESPKIEFLTKFRKGKLLASPSGVKLTNMNMDKDYQRISLGLRNPTTGLASAIFVPTL